jgi:hypothetical protein
LDYGHPLASLGIGVGYAFALTAGFARHGLHEPIADPVLAIMEVLTLLSAPAIVALMIQRYRRIAATATRAPGIIQPGWGRAR